MHMNFTALNSIFYLNLILNPLL